MYHFAVVALLGLAVLKVVDLLEDFIPGLTKFHTLITFALAIGACVAADYSMFRGWGIQLRSQWMGPVATGLVIGGVATLWHEAVGFVTSYARRAYDEGAEIERRIGSRAA